MGVPVDPADAYERRCAIGNTATPHAQRSVVSDLGYLQQLPALALFDRMPVPMLAIGADGVIVCANRACLTMLGYSDPNDLTGRLVTDITAPESRCTLPRDQIELLGYRAGSVMTWLHAQGHSVRAIVSETLLMRGLGSVFLVCLTDVGRYCGQGAPATPATQRGRLLSR